MSTKVVRAGVIILASVIKKDLQRKQKKNLKQKRKWIRSWIEKRDKYGASSRLLRELKDEDPLAYRNMLRLNSSKFDELLQMVNGMLKKKDTKMRPAIPVTTKLEITLRYLATGDSLKSLEYLFRVPESTISKFLPEVLTSISCALRPFIEVSEIKN